MAWVSPQYSRAEINRSAGVLISPELFHLDEAEHSFSVISNWRSAHSFPLNTFQMGLRNRAKQACKNPLISQRLKRLSSIAAKLQRFPEMRLSQMQDIAGCRAVVDSVQEVNTLATLYKNSDLKHPLAHEDDYILKPKCSGYRGIHLIYRYFSDKKATHNDLKVEVQIRSVLEHSWATAVETVGTFIQQALKSSQGEDDWLRFFALMGTAIALREGCAAVPGTSVGQSSLRQELRFYALKLDVENHLRAYAAALESPEWAGVKDAHYFLLELDPTARRVRITGYRAKELEKASSDYLTAERKAISSPRQGDGDVVLVSVESVAALKRAYPNYFLDTHRFISAVKQAVGRKWSSEPPADSRQLRLPF